MILLENESGLSAIPLHLYPSGSHSTNEFSEGAADVVSGTYHFNFISRGPEENPVVHADYHTTITPDGEVSTTFDNFRTECRG